jgi:hypothetical protein
MKLEGDIIYNHLPAIMEGGSNVSFDRFIEMQSVYLGLLAPNCVLMFVKLFKFIDVVPQMGLLIKVHDNAITVSLTYL